MKHKFSLNKFRMLSVLGILAFVFGYPNASPALATAPYGMTDLYTLGGPTSRPIAINNAGQVIGNSDTANMSTHAFMWASAGGLTDLYTLGGSNSVAVAINEAGQVTGSSSLANNIDYHAFVWKKGAGMTDLYTLGGRNSVAVAINEAGQVIGRSLLANNIHYHAFVWREGAGMTDLTPVGAYSSDAVAINEAGQVIGNFHAMDDGHIHAFVWKEGAGMTRLTPDGAYASRAVAINNAGQVIVSASLVDNNGAGFAHAFMGDSAGMTDLKTLGGRNSIPVAINDDTKVGNDGDSHAFVWKDGAMTDLDTFSGRSTSRPVAINEAGQVTGYALVGGRYHAFMWDGAMTDLQTLGGTYSVPVAINEEGQIAGTSTLVNGNGHAFVWEDGAMTDLQTLGGSWSYPLAINDMGQVIGDALRADNTSHAFLARPVTNTYIYIPGGTEQVSYDVSFAPQVSYSVYVAPHQSMRKSFAGVNSGPVMFNNTQSTSMMAAERVIYKVNGVPTSFSEMMGLPHSQMNTTHWLPWYNNVDLDTQLRFANPFGLTATVHVYIGGTEMPGSPFTLAGLASTRKSFPGINSGPVKIESTVNIVAAERVIYKVNGVNTSFSEMMGLPNSQLNTTYWLPWYNNVDLDTQLRFANVSGSPATVHVYIGGTEMAGSPFSLAVGASTRKSFAGINSGPVKIASDFPIVVAERVIYKVNGVNTSFSEMMGLPASQLDTTYWLPWYNNVDLDTQLRFANVSGSPATVHVYIGGTEMPGSPFTLAAGASSRKSFAGINNGPVKIESNVNIVAAERVIFKVNGINTSFSEMMGLPNSQLNITYWLPWYNNVDLDTQLRFGIP
jgi:probable HAF family extracellular repeat protein